MATTSMGSIFPRGPVWFIKLPHANLDKPKRGSSGIRISDAEQKVISDKRRWLKMASYAEAVKVRDQWIADLDAPKAAAVSSVTLAFACKRYYTSKVLVSPAVSRALAPEKTSIVRNFLSTVDCLYRGFGANTPIENITTPLISAFRDKLLVSGRRVAVKGKAKGEKVEMPDQGIAPSSINAYLRVLSAVLNREFEQYETIKVMPKIGMLDEDKDQNVWALEDSEVDRLRQAAQDYPHLDRVLRFAFDTGARKTEMMMLGWDKLEGLQAGSNTKAVVKFIEHTKFDKKRQLTITDSLRDMLRQMRQEQIDGGYTGDRVFAFRHKYSGDKWIEPAGLQETVWKVRAAAALPEFTLHICRHTFASRQLRAGKGLTLIQAMLGHSEYKTTQIYAKWAKENVVDAADALQPSVSVAGVVPAHASL